MGYTTKTLEERIKTHVYKSRCEKNKHYFYIFKEAIRKYGIDNFKWEILANCNSIEECYSLEKYFISKLNTISPNGYNLTIGGNGGGQSIDTIEKISNSLKEYWSKNIDKHTWQSLDYDTRSKWAKKAWLTKKTNGYIHPSFKQSEESKQKMSDTKNHINKLHWFNCITNEHVYLSCTKMAEKTGLSIGTFSQIKNGRRKQTKCGWLLIE